MKRRYYNRTEMARNYAQKIMDDPAHPGLFLAAPRRTGKTTFMKEDLAPALREAGAEVIYVDLWADKKEDPATLINRAIQGAVDRNLGAIAKLAKKSGLSKVSVGGVEIDTSTIGHTGGATIAEALATLSDSLGKPIALIIDEAQHAVTTANGNNALFALKAARDELNSSEHHGLRLICTGSSRDKLAMLRNSKDQAFYNAPLVTFPHLDKQYIAWFCANAALSFPLDPHMVWEKFQAVDYRPEALLAAKKEIEFEMFASAEQLNQSFAEKVDLHTKEMTDSTLAAIRSLTPIQAAVLKVMAIEGKDYAPFEAASTPKYVAMLIRDGMSEEEAKQAAYSGNVQQALSALQEKALIWKADRGVYAIEEQGIVEVLANAGLIPGTEPSDNATQPGPSGRWY